MASNPKLKVSVGMDHGQFDKGASQVKNNMRSLESVASDNLSKIGDLFGVNLGKVQQLGEALSGLGTKLTQSGSAGTQALGKIAKGAAAAGTAIAAIGIGAAVTAFRALNDEATAFKNTVEGANIALQTQAYLDTYRQAMHDLNSETGKAVAEFESRTQKWWGRLKQNASSFVVNLVTPGENSDATKTLAPTAALVNSIGTAWKATREQASKAGEAAAAAEPIARRIFEIQRQQSDNLVTIAELEKQIAEQREIASDSSFSAAQQLAAITKAQDLIHQKYALQIPLEQELARLMQEMDDLAGSSAAEVDAVNQQRAKAVNLAAQESNEIRSLLRRQTSLNSEVAKEAAERLKAMEAIAKSRQLMTDSAISSGPGIQGSAQTDMSGISGMDAWIAKQQAAGEAYAAEVQRIDALNKQMNDSFNAAIGTGVVDSIETMTDAIFGIEDINPGSIFAALLTPIAESAMKAGELILAQGVAVEAFNKSLSSLQGAPAIAAGLALIATASMIKSGLKALAGGGGYSASASVASSSYSSPSAAGGSDWQVQKMVFDVNLKAKGTDLVAVLNEETMRSNRRT